MFGDDRPHRFVRESLLVISKHLWSVDAGQYSRLARRALWPAVNPEPGIGSNENAIVN